MVCFEDIGGRRRAGTMFWQGLPNLFWWSDRTSGICGMYASQLTPSTDPMIVALFEMFEFSMYVRILRVGKELL